MTLNLPPEYEHLLSDAVARGHFASPDDALKHAIHLLAAEQEANETATQHASEEWSRTFRQWAESHPQTVHHVDVSREALYYYD